MVALVIHPLPGAGHLARAWAGLRHILSRLRPRLAGFQVVIIHGRPYVVRPRPLGVARELIPAILGMSESLVVGRMDDAFYDGVIRVLALGLDLPEKRVQRFTISLWECLRIVDEIARVNGLQPAEGADQLGKLIAVWTGTNSTPPSSPPPAGAGSTSTNA